jgi:hypothetical protein
MCKTKRSCILITEPTDNAINRIADKTGTTRARVIHESVRRKAKDELGVDVGDYPTRRAGRRKSKPTNH